MNIYVITNNNFMLEGLKCMFSGRSFSVNKVVFSRVSDIAFSNSDVVIVESELNTCDAERLKHLHFSPVNLIFLLKPTSGMGGIGREAVFIDTKLSGNEYLVMRRAFKKMGINLERDKLSFTKRESHIIHLILNGYSLEEISKILQISKRTVQTFVSMILHKLNATKISGIFRCKNLIIDSLIRKNHQ
ncbi:TPA: helix-turn-helix transcriptional regulator [Klebsiella quasipneumoniae subsp. quasipneumoniae]|nr:helix-turn-helix transcriptional regulator [Klebsiella quasipneumoniae subsp. quasipneumoniae]